VYANEWKFVMKTPILLAICAVLFAFGGLVVAFSLGFFMNLLGACIMGCGGSAAYLILSHGRKSET
jgi:hypothetical protein